MCRQHPAQQFLLPGNHKFLIVQRVVVSFLDQRRDVLFFQKELVKPCDLRQHLKVGEILRLEISFRSLRMIPVLAKPLPQLAVPRITSDQILRVRLKQVLQRKPALFIRKILGRLGRDIQERIQRRPGNIILYLDHQRRHKIEVLMNLRKLIQQLHHSVIVFERVQSRPRQAILAGDQVFIKRLVLMPKKDDAQDGHGWSSQSSMGENQNMKFSSFEACNSERSKSEAAILRLCPSIAKSDGCPIVPISVLALKISCTRLIFRASN
jgi:hypothetical protein